MIINIINGNVLDPVAGKMIGERSIVVENDVIVDVLEGRSSVKPDLEIDGRGRYVLPGFIDAHVHLSMTTMNFGRALRLSEVEWSLGMHGGVGRSNNTAGIYNRPGYGRSHRGIGAGDSARTVSGFKDSTLWPRAFSDWCTWRH
jgi:formylmethanofuran dehydrogenase subunit A